jgi:hypothetical protein
MDKNFNPDSLRDGIKRCKKNIQIFEDAIKKEEDTIRQFREYLRIAEAKQEARRDGN